MLETKEFSLINKLNAEADYYKAQTKQINEIARREKSLADRYEIETAKAKREEQYLVNSNFLNHTLVIEEITDDTSSQYIQQLTTWDRIDGDNPLPITLIINSPGGNVYDGFAIIDTLRLLQTKGHEITTYCIGVAASMAGIILQASNHRIMGANSLVIIHDPSTFDFGRYSAVELEDKSKYMAEIREHIFEIFLERINHAKINGTATKPITIEDLRTNSIRKEWYIWPKEALEGGIIDEIR